MKRHRHTRARAVRQGDPPLGVLGAIVDELRRRRFVQRYRLPDSKSGFELELAVEIHSACTNATARHQPAMAPLIFTGKHDT